MTAEPTREAAASCTIENRTLTLNGRRAFFREATPLGESLGSLILLHGWIGTSSWMFQHVLPELGARYHTVAPDLPGFGRSQTLADAPSIEGYREFVRQLADQLEIDRFHLVGVSVGGTVALDFAHRYPERVTKLVVQGPVYRATDLPKRFRVTYDLLGRIPIITDLIPKMPVKWWFFVRRLDMGRDTRHLSDEDKRQLGRDILRVPNETLLDVGRELLDIDMSDMARRIVVPTLVLDGSDARMVPASASRELSRMIPGAKWRVIRDAGHNVAIEKPREFLRAVLGFLEPAVGPP
ncbi:MAG TPA: alpha/beta hydrolase [Dehalococcoidia bacterium]|nr:alpha/beta hydrolase [Dehalococcoidia bacterium]